MWLECMFKIPMRSFTFVQDDKEKKNSFLRQHTNHLLYPSYLPCFQLNFNTVWMNGGTGENVGYHPFGKCTAALVMFLNYKNRGAGAYIFSWWYHKLSAGLNNSRFN